MKEKQGNKPNSYGKLMKRMLIGILQPEIKGYDEASRRSRG